jgi:hypothetical protein
MSGGGGGGGVAFTLCNWDFPGDPTNPFPPTTFCEVKGALEQRRIFSRHFNTCVSLMSQLKVCF